ncbi:MAG: hypothetical protein DWI57_11015 [Chloroflexi bacterium]|nr:MAG: hypothetical protein DWI57_11015 [Chloroflexota bacterium]
MALDAADASPALQGYLANATGAWLYLFDEALRTDVRGGLLHTAMHRHIRPFYIRKTPSLLPYPALNTPLYPTSGNC